MIDDISKSLKVRRTPAPPFYGYYSLPCGRRPPPVVKVLFPVSCDQHDRPTPVYESGIDPQCYAYHWPVNLRFGFGTQRSYLDAHAPGRKVIIPVNIIPTIRERKKKWGADLKTGPISVMMRDKRDRFREKERWLYNELIRKRADHAVPDGGHAELELQYWSPVVFIGGKEREVRGCRWGHYFLTVSFR